MKKEKWERIFSNLFNIDLERKNKFTFYNNPNVCNTFNYEKINPEHIGYIWGKRKEKHKGCNWIKVCKIQMHNILFGLSYYLKELLNFTIYIFEHIDVFMLLYSFILAIIFYGILLNIDTIGIFLSTRKIFLY